MAPKNIKDLLCNGEILWDDRLTWTNNSWPQFTECFQNTVLTWIPCGWIWISAPFYAYHLLSIKKKIQRVRVLFLFKMFCILAMIALHITDAFETFKVRKSIASMISPLIWIATMFLHSYLLYLEKTRKKARSPISFVYWILVTLVVLVPLYSNLILKTSTSDAVALPVMCLKFGVALLSVILQIFPDYVNKKDNVGKNPEIFSSFLSWIFLFWFERLVIKGLRTQLSDDDIFNLRPQDKTKCGIDKFLHHWDAEQSRQMSKKAKQKYKLEDNWDTQIPLLSLAATHAHSTASENIYQDATGDQNTNKQDSVFDQNGKESELNHDHLHSDAYIDVRKYDQGEILTPQISFLKTLCKCFWLDLLSGQSGMLMLIATSILSPIVLGWLINFTKDPTEYAWHGYIYAAAFILLRLLNSTFVNVSKWFNNRVASKVQCTTIAAIFRKSLIMSNEARKKSTTGEIINLMSIDVNHIESMLIGSFWSWVSAVLLVVGVYLLYTIMGVALLAGLGFMLLLFCMNILSSQKMRKYQEIIMTIKDERMKILNEILNGIKVVKLSGWELMFIKKVLDVRERELKIYFKYCILAGFESFTWHVANIWTLYLMIVTFVMTSENQYLGATTVFLTINYTSLIKIAMNMLPSFIGDLVKALNSISRINKLLNSENINSLNLQRNNSDSLAIRIINGDFAWIKSGPIILKSINLEVEPGKLIAVVGPVGCGKSSLLAAMLGEMYKLNGYFNLNSSVAYVQQQAWIQNNTLKENILFGKKYDEQFFNQVINACALTPDLDIMPAGADTEIGEKGINLSGGQKQRVSLARAAYSQADIYLLDDSLSAVDSHVGKHIFDNMLGKEGLLSGKTRVLVTHGIYWLPFVDQILVMSDGRIIESGTYDGLLSHNGPFAKFLVQYLTQNNEFDKASQKQINVIGQEVKRDILRRLVSVTSEGDGSIFSEQLTKKSDALEVNISTSTLFGSCKDFDDFQSSEQWQGKSEVGKTYQKNVLAVSEKNRLTTDEKIEPGKVKWELYYRLVQSLGLNSSVIILLLFISYQVTYNYCHFWLADWSDDARLNNFTDLPAGSEERKDVNVYYLGVFTGLTFLMSIFEVTYAVVFQMGHIKAARTFHNDLLKGVMHAPMSFFDTTPIGRILNRFSQDIDNIDSNIFLEIETCLDNFLKCLSTLVVISYTMPVFLSMVVPILIILYFIQQMYIRSSCQIRRLTSKNRSPIYAHFSETLSGTSVIRAYQVQDMFIADSLKKVDTFQKSYLAYKGLNRWLEARLGLVTLIISITATILAVKFKDDLSPGLVGLAVTYALRISNDMTVLTITFGNLENHIVSLERIIEYSTIKSEAAWECHNVTSMWPTHGSIEFINYSTRYRDGMFLVLRNINCVIHGGEKIGIVGRTGAGKSSMMLSLLRLLEAAEGKITIDGVDIATLGLHTLRKNLTILPQDPVLFAGSIRMNLDPFNEKTDSEIWQVLENTHMKSYIESLPFKLEYEVGEGGQNLSMGQRQLLCLTRALLKKSNIFILDEATAAVDMETDEFIQKSIKEEFIGCTVLTIAHRINTVMDYDRIMVLEEGQVVEFDSPRNLLQREDSLFYFMATQAGLI